MTGMTSRSAAWYMPTRGQWYVHAVDAKSHVVEVEWPDLSKYAPSDEGGVRKCLAQAPNIPAQFLPVEIYRTPMNKSSVYTSPSDRKVQTVEEPLR